MSDDAEDLRLNTLNRFSKRSPRLVLEEHSSCEVPAGCGGVVLRWRDPTEGHPFRVSVACAGRVRLVVDGAPIAGTAVPLRPGLHELLLHLTALPDAPSPLGFELETGEPGGLGRETVLTAADGGFSLVEPGSDGALPVGPGRRLAPFTGDLAAQERRWWFEQFASGLLELPPGEAWVYRELEVVDARRVR